MFVLALTLASGLTLLTPFETKEQCEREAANAVWNAAPGAAPIESECLSVPVVKLAEPIHPEQEPPCREPEPKRNRISDVEIAIAARGCVANGMRLYVVRENGRPVATTCIVEPQ